MGVRGHSTPQSFPTSGEGGTRARMRRVSADAEQPNQTHCLLTCVLKRCFVHQVPSLSLRCGTAIISKK